MKNLYKYIVIVFIVFIIPLKYGISQCKGFLDLSHCRVTVEQDFKPYGQSKSALVLAKETFQYKLVLYGNKDYIIGLCTDLGYYPIHFKIINADRNETLYDNETDEYIESVGFSNEKTQNIIIEITVLAENVEIEDATDKRVCVGVNILWRKMPKIGF